MVAAETSSALYAQRLLEHWNQSHEPVRAFGIGNQAMEKLGFDVYGKSEEMAVVGLTEVIKHWGTIKKSYYACLEAVKSRRPKVALLMDYPGFNLRFAAELKKLGIPVVYYISPQVWAWHQSRVHKIKKLVDRMLVLFPFEKDFYEKFGVNVDFVGHPLLDEIKDDFFTEDYHRLHRQRYGIESHDLVLGLMPGSRSSELQHHLKTQLEAAQILHTKHHRLKVALFVAPNFETESIQEMLPRMAVPLIVIKDEPFEMIDLADVVLCASGTATLMVGLMEKPMVIMYRMNPMTALFAKTFVKSTKYFGMINLVLDKEVCPEFFQERANPSDLAQALSELIQSPNKRSEITSQLKEAKSRLGNKGATLRVAEILNDYFEGSG